MVVAWLRRCHRADPSPIASRRRSLSSKGKFRMYTGRENEIASKFLNVVTWTSNCTCLLRYRDLNSPPYAASWSGGRLPSPRMRQRAGKPRRSGVHATRDRNQTRARLYSTELSFPSVNKNNSFKKKSSLPRRNCSRTMSIRCTTLHSIIGGWFDAQAPETMLIELSWPLEHIGVDVEHTDG